MSDKPWNAEQFIVYNAINKIKNKVVFDEIFTASDEDFLKRHLNCSKQELDKVVGDLRLKILCLLRDLSSKSLSD